MTHKDFQKIADTLQKANVTHAIDASAFAMVALEFADMLQRDNRNFDPFRFFKAAGLDDDTANWLFKYL